MSNIVFSNNQIQLGGKTFNTSNMGRLSGVHRVMESADVALASCASGGTRVGNSFSANIPTSGQIEVNIPQVEFLGTNISDGSVGIAVEVGGATYWATITQGGTTTYIGMYIQGTGGKFIGAHPRLSTTSNIPGILTVIFDIAALGCSTGQQSCYLRLGGSAWATYTDAVTVKGTVTPFAAAIKIIDFT